MHKLRPPDPPLRDGDVLLRPSRPDDLDAILAVYREEDVQHWMGWDFLEPDGPTEDESRSGAFDELGIARIELRAHPENVPSQRVAERVGFVREGVERASRAWASGERVRLRPLFAPSC